MAIATFDFVTRESGAAAAGAALIRATLGLFWLGCSGFGRRATMDRRTGRVRRA